MNTIKKQRNYNTMQKICRFVYFKGYKQIKNNIELIITGAIVWGLIYLLFAGMLYFGLSFEW